MKLISIPLSEAETELIDTGLLYAINTLVMHPLGLAIAFSGETPENMTNLQLMRTEDGEPLVFSEEMVREGRMKFTRWLHALKPETKEKLMPVLGDLRVYDYVGTDVVVNTQALKRIFKDEEDS